ncbi:MAG TPA: kelch repeat-containing protein, partial [Thermoplasmata archaeon]|nr:kelch repeat-containing protein [Thermoplasmata archaeon]
MTYDPSDHEVVLFGGYDGGTTYYADTWVFANGTWNQLNPTVYPTARWRTPGLAYDAADGYVVLFGGSDSSNNALSDTWEFVGNAWTKLSPTGAPVGRCRAGEVYDANDSEIVVFGGDTSCTSSSGTFDTWVYSAGAWKMLTLTTHPISRVYPQLVYDPAESAVILFGGAMASGGTTNYQDTWKFTGNVWTQVTSGAGTPPSTRGYGMTSFDPEGGYVFLFGGGDGGAGYFNDSWAYGPSAVIWGSVAPSPTDVGVKLWINTTTVTAKGVSPVTYNYSGLPTGCASSNLSRINCTTTGNGAFNVVVGVNTSRGITSFANLSAIVNLDPTITGIVMSPPQVEVGITTRINTTVVGGSAPFTYSYTNLPPGCTSQNVSSLLCAPTTTGSFTYRVHVLDGAGVGANRTAILVVNTPPSRLNSTFTAFPPAVDVGSSTHLYANISGGTAPFVFTWSGLPSGCTAANASTLLCAPIVPGRAAISVRVVDTFGLAIVGTINITVNAALDLVKFGISPLKVDAGVKVTFYANVTGGTSPYSYLFTGLPSGCSLANAPTPTCTPRGIGSFLITAKVSDGAFVSVSKSLTLTIVPDPTVTAFNASPTRLDVGQSVNLNVATQNGTAPLNFSYSGLPAGCQGSYSNSFTCSPLVAGVFPVTVTARDAWKVSSSASLNLTVAPKPKITSFSLTPNSLAPGGNLLVN